MVDEHSPSGHIRLCFRLCNLYPTLVGEGVPNHDTGQIIELILFGEPPEVFASNSVNELLIFKLFLDICNITQDLLHVWQIRQFVLVRGIEVRHILLQRRRLNLVHLLEHRVPIVVLSVNTLLLGVIGEWDVLEAVIGRGYLRIHVDWLVVWILVNLIRILVGWSLSHVHSYMRILFIDLSVGLLLRLRSILVLKELIWGFIHRLLIKIVSELTVSIAREVTQIRQRSIWLQVHGLIIQILKVHATLVLNHRSVPFTLVKMCFILDIEVNSFSRANGVRATDAHVRALVRLVSWCLAGVVQISKIRMRCSVCNLHNYYE